MRITLLFIFLLYSISLFSQKDNIQVNYADKITASDLKKYLYILASDSFEGRETGKKGQKMAAEYIANHFRHIGIPTLANGTYYQTYPIELQKPGGEILFGSNKYQFLKDFYYFPGFSDLNSKESEVVFLGYGISDSIYDDYKNADVKNKILVVLDGEPVGKNKKSLVSKTSLLTDWTTQRRRKQDFAKERGAKALFIIVDDIQKNIKINKHFIENPTMKVGQQKDKQQERLPVFYITSKMADKLIGEKSKTLKKKISSTGKPVYLNKKSDLTINITREKEEISAENVLGYIEGTDLKNELLIITAHYDHLGKDGKIVFNGADDDGSGTVAIMELAESFAIAKKEGKGPRRSILFMAVSGEEKGLLGSKYYTENPVYPLNNTIADLNIDMIGRLDEKHKNNANYIYVIGADKLSTDLHKINENANKTYSNLELDYTFNDINDKNRFYYRSDHYNFAKNNIPVIFYFNGVHDDYHKETDEVSKIDFIKMEKITRLVFHTAWELANRTERIKVDRSEK